MSTDKNIMMDSVRRNFVCYKILYFINSCYTNTKYYLYKPEADSDFLKQLGLINALYENNIIVF